MEKTLSLREACGSEPFTNIALIVPKSLLLVIKEVLISYNVNVPRAKYELVVAPLKVSQGTGVSSMYSDEQHYKVPTNLRVWLRDEKRLPRNDFLRPYGNLHCLLEQIDWVFEPKPATRSSNKLENLIKDWVKTLPIEDLDLKAANTLRCSTFKYRLFDASILLPSEARCYLDNLSCYPQIHALYEEISKAFKRPRIAVSARIPAFQSRETCSSAVDRPILAGNIKRLPLDITPLYGDFGDLISGEPAEGDLADAYWERTCQNGIWQVWAPLYTMFSSGNLSEKKRVLELESFKTQQGDCTAVDLYAGIGYFAFSYAKAGASKVLCWEINAWSVEGMRRGAEANGWQCKVVPDSSQPHPNDLEGDVKLIAFYESNEKAMKRVNAIRSSIPPVRHVNCGFLPSSYASWKVAVGVLDVDQGGWVHVHENVHDIVLTQRIEEILKMFRWLVQGLHASLPTRYSLPKVSCEHCSRVKSYAPRMRHWVFDILIGPSWQTGF